VRPRDQHRKYKRSQWRGEGRQKAFTADIYVLCIYIFILCLLMAISCIEYKMRLMLGTENQNGRLCCRRREKITSKNKKNIVSFNFLEIF